MNSTPHRAAPASGPPLSPESELAYSLNTFVDNGFHPTPSGAALPARIALNLYHEPPSPTNGRIVNSLTYKLFNSKTRKHASVTADTAIPPQPAPTYQ